jgi:hypothetical protein
MIDTATPTLLFSFSFVDIVSLNGSITTRHEYCR